MICSTRCSGSHFRPVVDLNVLELEDRIKLAAGGVSVESGLFDGHAGHLADGDQKRKRQQFKISSVIHNPAYTGAQTSHEQPEGS